MNDKIKKVGEVMKGLPSTLSAAELMEVVCKIVVGYNAEKIIPEIMAVLAEYYVADNHGEYIAVIKKKDEEITIEKTEKIN